MNTFLTILILFFIVIAIWQIVKIYDLTQVSNVVVDNSEIANDKDNRIRYYQYALVEDYLTDSEIESYLQVAKQYNIT